MNIHWTFIKVVKSQVRCSFPVPAAQNIDGCSFASLSLSVALSPTLVSSAHHVELCHHALALAASSSLLVVWDKQCHRVSRSAAPICPRHISCWCWQFRGWRFKFRTGVEVTIGMEDNMGSLALERQTTRNIQRTNFFQPIFQAFSRGNSATSNCLLFLISNRITTRKLKQDNR